MSHSGIYERRSSVSGNPRFKRDPHCPPARCFKFLHNLVMSYSLRSLLNQQDQLSALLYRGKEKPVSDELTMEPHRTKTQITSKGNNWNHFPRKNFSLAIAGALPCSKFPSPTRSFTKSLHLSLKEFSLKMKR